MIELCQLQSAESNTIKRTDLLLQVDPSNAIANTWS